jgi:hypothetical protein
VFLGHAPHQTHGRENFNQCTGGSLRPWVPNPIRVRTYAHSDRIPSNPPTRLRPKRADDYGGSLRMNAGQRLFLACVLLISLVHAIVIILTTNRTTAKCPLLRRVSWTDCFILRHLPSEQHAAPKRRIQVIMTYRSVTCNVQQVWSTRGVHVFEKAFVPARERQPPGSSLKDPCT